ncbi:MAG: hypothetical protein QM831_06025 [Kofleriaceae bacterium]
MKIRNVFVCVALALAPGCSKSPDAMMDKMMDMMDELGNAVEGANGDCAKMADGVNAVAKKYEGDMKAMKEMGEKMKGDKAKAEELQKKYGPRMEKAMPKMMGMMKCADDPKMKEVQEKLKGMM